MTVTQATWGTGRASGIRLAVETVITGLAWMIAVENIIARIDPSTTKWLPGAALETVASGGTEGPTFSHGLLVGALYVVVAVAAAAVTFARADMTA